MKSALEFKNLSFAYPDGKNVFENVNLTVSKGEFVLITGLTGSGKTTLLRHAKPELTPAGERSGEIFFDVSVSYVMQNPENQIVMDTVFDELSFGMENNGWDPALIRRRVAEISAFFGLEEMMDTLTSDLSGGEKQLLSLAAAVALEPGLLVLDEPTALLDPVASQSFWEILGKLNRELGIAILVSEHSLDEVLSLCDRALLLKNGTIKIDDKPREFAGKLINEGLFKMLPEPSKLASHLGIKGDLPLSVREARALFSGKNIVSIFSQRGDINQRGSPDPLDEISSDSKASSGIFPKFMPRDTKEEVLSARDLWFSYGNSENFALKGASFSLKKGEIHALLGGNGSGKSTLLRLFAGLNRPSRGKLSIKRKTALLPQDPKAMFWNDELLKDLLSLAEKFGKGRDEVDALMKYFELGSLKSRHPYDLSGGEMQKAALLKLLLTDAEILLLDEATKGLDAVKKDELKGYFIKLKENGKSIILVTHDLSFAASCADRCTFLSRGISVCTEESSAFFKGNYFYTTDTYRITQTCVSWEDAFLKDETVTVCMDQSNGTREVLLKGEDASK